MEAKELLNVSLKTDGMHVTRQFEFDLGTIDIALTFTSTTPLTLDQIHVATIQIALDRLQKMLVKAKEVAGVPANP